MKAILKILCILTVVCMSLITVSASAFAEATNQSHSLLSEWELGFNSC